MKTFTLLALVLLSGCTYVIKGAGHSDKTVADNLKKAQRCTFAPLWLAPLDEHFADIDSIARSGGIQEVTIAKQKIYPYVLFTRYCTVVKGR